MAKPKKEVDTSGLSIKEKLRAKLKKIVGEGAGFLDESDMYQITDYFDTGSFLLNAQICGNGELGMPNNCVLQLAGPPSSGKTYLGEKICNSAISKGYTILKYESEGSGDKDSMIGKGLTADSVMIMPMDTIENLTTSVLKTLDELTVEDKVMIVIDSIGNLSSTKELTDSTSGNEKRDMTKQQKLRALFRTMMVKSFVKRVPILVMNHVYEQIGAYVPTKIISGGQGAEYGSSIILMLSKSIEKNDDKKPIAAIIRSEAYKNRFAKEKTKVKIGLDYRYGIRRYFGVFDMMCEFKIIDDSSQGWYSYTDENGKVKKVRKVDITNQVIKMLIETTDFKSKIKDEFKYANQTEPENEDEQTVDDGFEGVEEVKDEKASSEPKIEIDFTETT